MAETAGHAPFLYRLARTLYEASGWREGVSKAAEAFSPLAPRSSILIFLLDPEGKEFQCVHSPEGASVEGRSVGKNTEGDLLIEALAGDEPRVFEGRRLTEETLRHLKWDSREPPATLTIVPLRYRGRSVGALEAAGPAPEPGSPLADASLLTETGSLLGSSFSLLRSHEGRGLGQLEAITRLTQLYDIGRSFNSTLELEELLPLVANRVANIVQAEQCNVWLVEPDGSLSCAAAWGPAAGAVRGGVLQAGEGIVGQVVSTGKDLVATGASAADLARDGPEAQGGLELRTVAAAILEAKEQVLGALEVINRTGGGRFTRADLPFLRDLASQAGIALHNARLLETERKVGELHALLEIGREATSTLDLNRVLAAIVNRGSTLLPYQRAAIGLREGGRIRVAALSGVLEVDPKAEDVMVLSEAVRWAADREEGLYLSEVEGEIATDVPGAREKFAEYFRETGMRSFVSFPLADEEGRLGVLTMESSAPYFLSEPQLEVAQILSLQATVAIRNARLYQQVPLISVMEPLLRKKRAWGALPRWKRAALTAGAVALLAALVLLPWRLRVGGTATVIPLRRIAVSAGVDGTVERVDRREGDRVLAGEVIAIVQDLDTRMALEEARADRDIARREKTRLEAGLEFARAQMEGTRLAQMEEEVALLEKKVEQTRLRAPADGVILTPRIEEKVGSLLGRGEIFCELADASGPVVEVQVPEEDLGGIRVGEPVWVKVPAFPSRTFRGEVYQVGARAVETPEGRFFVVRARVDAGSRLRPGMTGRAKVSAGSRSIGTILFRRPARWIWGKLWPYLP